MYLWVKWLNILIVFPNFLTRSLFGKVVEMSGLARSIATTLIKVVGKKERCLLSFY